MENSSQSCTLKMLKSQQVFVLLTGESPLSYVTCSKISLTKVGSYTICWYCKNHHRTHLKVVQHAIRFIHIISRSNFDKNRSNNYLDYVTRAKVNLMYFSLETTCDLNSCFITLYFTEWLEFIYLVTLQNEQLSKFNCSYKEIARQEL